MNEQSATSLEQRLEAAFDAMVAAEAEVPTSVTVADLIESGRRQVRVRRRRGRTTLGLSVATVTAMAVAIGVVAGTGQGHGGVGAAKGGSNSSAQPSPAVRFDRMRTPADPATSIVAFGWLPSGHDGEYQISQDDTGASGVQVWGPGNELLSAFVDASASATDPTLTHIPAGEVQGHPAFWATGAPGTAAVGSRSLDLVWQYSPGASAMIVLSNAANTTANGEMMLEVARHLEIGSVRQAAMPFRLPALPGGTHPESVDLDLPHAQGPKAGSAALRLCIVSPCFQTGGLLIRQDSTTWMAGSSIGIDSAPQSPGGGAPKTGGTPVTVGGRTARLWTNASGATVSFTYETAQVTIESAGREYQALGGKDGFLAFCGSLAWFGADPAHWTTNVLG